AFLRPQANGPVAAFWYERDDQEIRTEGHHCWLTVDARQVPGLPRSVGGYLSVFTDEKKLAGGRIEITEDWPQRSGTPLYAYPASVLPPIDAVFLLGNKPVGDWLRENGWQRDWAYNGNFKDKTVAEGYENAFFREYPLYLDADIYAMLGGWHLPFPDSDWRELMDERLVILTLRDSEPWVEAWYTKEDDFRVIQRIT